jgi:chaperonin GroEL
MNKIFISYSRDDADWKNRLTVHLRGLEKQGLLTVWDDSKIATGTNWKNEVENALNEASMVILLISGTFLASDFILREEVIRVLDRKKRDGIRVIPIFVKPSVWKEVEWLSSMQGFPKSGDALSLLEENKANNCLVELAREIKEYYTQNKSNRFPNTSGYLQGEEDAAVLTRQELLEGVNKIAAVARITYGPKGHNVMIQYGNQGSIFTKDIDKILESLDLGDSAIKIPLQLLRNQRKSERVGSFKTLIILVQSIFSESLSLLKEQKLSGISVKRGLNLIANEIFGEIQKLSTPIEIKKVILSLNKFDKEITTIVEEAIEKAGIQGVITVEEAKGTETTVEVVAGMRFDRGYISPYFVTNSEKMQAELQNPYILIYDKKISTMKDILHILEKVAQSGRPLLIIAENLEGEALATLVVNKLRGTIKVAAVKAPSFGDYREEMIQDIAILTKGIVISEELGYKLENADLTYLGACASVTIDKDNTTIIGGKGKKEDITARINQIKEQIETSISDYDKERLQERIAYLARGIVVIYGGGFTDEEVLKKKEEIKDAMFATKAALIDGVVPGGGVAYFRATQSLSSTNRTKIVEFCIQILKKALREPLKQILLNADINADSIIADLEKRPPWHGYILDIEEYGNLNDHGIIDPTSVVISNLKNAISLVGEMLIGHVILGKEKEVQESNAIPPKSGS